jgi:hypothetical protein
MTKHAKLSPSTASRWLACPGSVALSEKVEQPEPSIYAKEGTAAHKLAELLMTKGAPADRYLGKKLNGIEVTKEMIAAVDHYLNYIFDIEFESECTIQIERKVKLLSGLYGTADCLVYNHEDQSLHVIDYKHGIGVPVAVENNPQLIIYGLAAAKLFTPTEIHLTIVQPRTRETDRAIQVWSVDAKQLKKDWLLKLKAGIKRVYEEPNTFKTGSHCRWCNAKIICPAQQKEAQKLAKLEFSEPAELSKKQIKHILDSADRVQAFIEEVRKFAHRTINEGGSIPGYKLVQRRSNRQWTNEKDVIRKLKDRRLKKEIIFTEPKLKSPAQLEKIVGKDKALKKFIEKHTTKPDTGLTLVPVSDSREATTAARKDFEE